MKTLFKKLLPLSILASMFLFIACEKNTEELPEGTIVDESGKVVPQEVLNTTSFILKFFVVPVIDSDYDSPASNPELNLEDESLVTTTNGESEVYMVLSGFSPNKQDDVSVSGEINFLKNENAGTITITGNLQVNGADVQEVEFIITISGTLENDVESINLNITVDDTNYVFTVTPEEIEEAINSLPVEFNTLPEIFGQAENGGYNYTQHFVARTWCSPNNPAWNTDGANFGWEINSFGDCPTPYPDYYNRSNETQFEGDCVLIWDDEGLNTYLWLLAGGYTREHLTHKYLILDYTKEYLIVRETLTAEPKEWLITAGRSNVTVLVVDSQGNPVENAMVELMKSESGFEDMPELATTYPGTTILTTNSQGMALFSDLTGDFASVWAKVGEDFFGNPSGWTSSDPDFIPPGHVTSYGAEFILVELSE